MSEKKTPNGDHCDSTASLVRRASRGEATAQEQLLGRFLPRFRQWAHGRLPGPARGHIDTDDLVQNTLIKALDRLPDFELRHNGGFFGYLRRILLNQICDEIRKAERRQTKALPLSLMDRSTSALDRLIKEEDRRRYEEALQSLPTMQKEAIFLRFELNLKYREIADALGCPSEDAARMLVARALVKLAEAMRKET